MSPGSTGTAQAFWDEAWSRSSPHASNLDAYWEQGEFKRGFITLIGDVRGKRVLELGCGNGLLAVYLALRGAAVTATDISAVALENTRALAKAHGVDALITVHQLEATALACLAQPFELVVGRYILHHIEPFDRFAGVLFNAMEPGGRGVFLENSARNPLLLFARKYLAGRFGIPRFGDEEEFPLEPREIEMLAGVFPYVRLHYPDFVFFRNVNTYVLRHHKRLRFLQRGFKLLDTWIYRHVPSLHKYSYNQVVELERRAPERMRSWDP